MSKDSNEETLDLLIRASRHENYEFREILGQIYDRHGKNTPSSCLNEIRLDGSNTILNIFRGRPSVDYDEVVADVARKIGIPNDKITDDYKNNEILILEKVSNDFWSTLPPEERSNKLKHLTKLDTQFNYFNMLLSEIKPLCKQFSAWIIQDIAGPAFRKTIPTVITIALLRLQLSQ